MRKYRVFITLAFVLFFASSCQYAPKPVEQVSPLTVTEKISGQVQDERDEIYTLLAYAVVLKDWQTGGPEQRGHNIGSVLVNKDNKVVFWARNCNHITKNGTQHGEVRLIIGYLDKIQSYNLDGYTIYTTLEPCAQCSGMMTLQSIKRTVYGQADQEFGKAIERLQLDTSELPKLLPEKYKYGYKPYPRPVISEQSKSIICEKLNKAYAQVGGSVTKFLLSDDAKKIYEKALEMLLNYEIKYEENKSHYEDAINFLNNTVTE